MRRPPQCYLKTEANILTHILSNHTWSSSQAVCIRNHSWHDCLCCNTKRTQPVKSGVQPEDEDILDMDAIALIF